MNALITSTFSPNYKKKNPFKTARHVKYIEIDIYRDAQLTLPLQKKTLPSHQYFIFQLGKNLCLMLLFRCQLVSRHQTHNSCIGRRILYHCPSQEAQALCNQHLKLVAKSVILNDLMKYPSEPPGKTAHICTIYILFVKDIY